MIHMPALTINACTLLGALAFCLTNSPAFGDVIEMQNGDRYGGTVLAVNSTNLLFQSETQGRINLPRDKVSRVTFGKNVTPAPAIAPKTALTTNNTPDLLQQLRQASPKADASSQVKDLLSSAGPEATQKFNETLQGLMSGKISMNDIRQQARESVEQLQEAKGEFGGEMGDLLDGYLGILQNFLKETEPAHPAPPPIVRQKTTVTNQAPAAPVKK